MCVFVVGLFRFPSTKFIHKALMGPGATIEASAKRRHAVGLNLKQWRWRANFLLHSHCSVLHVLRYHRFVVRATKQLINEYFFYFNTDKLSMENISNHFKSFFKMSYALLDLLIPHSCFYQSFDILI